MIVMLVFGWMPGYLFFNASGPKKYKNVSHSHFNPYSALFKADDRLDIVISDIGFGLVIAGLIYATQIYGGMNVIFHYVIPYMLVNYHLVLITYLQHTDVFLPHLRGNEWTWLRGALCTVDRSFGSVYDHFLHHITDSHVVHHVFSKMPFYNAKEATPYVKAILKEYYLSDDTPIATALWRSFSLCRFVEDQGGVVFYKNKL